MAFDSLPFDSVTGPPSSNHRKVPRPATDKTISVLGERLKRAWEHAGLTQSSLETRLVERGVMRRGYMSRLKYGERENTSVKILDAAAEICGVDFEWLATGRGSMLPRRQPKPVMLDRTPSPPSAVRPKRDH